MKWAKMMNVADEDGLVSAEMVPRGGSWGGLLFDNPRTGLPLGLRWEFTFEFEDIRRDYGSTGCHLSVDWVPWEVPDWRAVPPGVMECQSFAEPIESSVYFFEHYRMDSTRMEVLSQAGGILRARAEVAGDIDGLGIDEIIAEGDLTFGGIVVAPSQESSSPDAARELLSGFTSTEGLAVAPLGSNYRFTPER